MKNGKSLSLTELLRAAKEEAARGKQQSPGKEKSRRGETGKYRGSTAPGSFHGDPSRLHLPATLRAAAPWQAHRRALEEAELAGKRLAVRIEKGDFCEKRRRKGQRAAILFVLDASRSQGADRRLSFAKGAILSLLTQAYTAREKTGLLVFGNGRAYEAVPFTKSPEYAAKCLEHMSASGNTPLALGLEKAVEVLEEEQKKNGEFFPFLVVITDGKANYDPRPGDSWDYAKKAAEEIRARRIPSLVIDTDTGVFSLGMAKKLAGAMGGEYGTL